MLGEVRAGRQEAEGDRGVRGEGSTADWGPGHGEDRTENMRSMVVTLEVSKLSGWLNTGVYCQESNRGHAVRGEGAGQQTGATASSVQCRLDCRLGAIAVRTQRVQGRARLQIGSRARGVKRT